MFENNDYYELQLMKEFLLSANSFGKSGIEAYRPLIKAIEDEMARRESIARRRLLSVVAVNLIVLASIVLTSGCVSTIRGTGQMISGVGQGGGTIVTGIGDFLIDEMKGK